MSEYELRPHHGLCIAFFEGKGYSGAFVRNMTSVISRLESEDPDVRIVLKEDVLCYCCPRNKDGGCGDSGKVLRYDRAVSEICGLNSGSVISWSELCGIVNEKIISAGRLKEICSDCRWHEICNNRVMSHES